MRNAILILLASFVLEACRDGGESDWSVQPVHVAGPVPGFAVLGAIRAAEHDGFDRLVVEFDNQVVPGYHVSYLEDAPIECGSGEGVDVAGEANLEVRLEPARGYNDQGESTLSHAGRIFDLSAMDEAHISCDFEGVFTIVVGLPDRLPFRVTTLQDPSRLVIDVQTDSTVD